MPDTRSIRIRMDNVRLNCYLVGQDSHSEPEGHSSVLHHRPNMAVASRGGSRGQARRVAGATAPTTILPVQQARNRATRNDG